MSDKEHLTLTVRQFAELIQVSVPTAYRIVGETGFPAFHVGRKVLIHRRALDAWLSDQVQNSDTMREVR